MDPDFVPGLFVCMCRYRGTVLWYRSRTGGRFCGIWLVLKKPGDCPLVYFWFMTFLFKDGRDADVIYTKKVLNTGAYAT